MSSEQETMATSTAPPEVVVHPLYRAQIKAWLTGFAGVALLIGGLLVPKGIQVRERFQTLLHEGMSPFVDWPLQWVGIGLSQWLVIILGVSLIGIGMLAAFVSVRSQQIVLDRDYITIYRGLIPAMRDSRSIAYRNIIEPYVRITWYSMLLRYGHIKLSTAGADGYSAILRGIAEPRRLKQLILERRDETFKAPRA